MAERAGSGALKRRRSRNPTRSAMGICMTDTLTPMDPGGSFAAIDFETATSQRYSACAVGMVVFEQGAPISRLRRLIRPPGNRYDPFNTWIHGIGPSDTLNCPPFPEVWDQVAGMLDGRLVVAHNTAFDMSVLRRSAEHYGYEPEPFPFACTYRIARSAMPEAGSWALDIMANEFGIPLAHHDPLSDAEAAGMLWLALSRRFGMTHPQLLELHNYRLGYCHLDSYKPFSNATPSKTSSKSFSAKDFTPQHKLDPEGPIFAKKIVFTGTLESMPRREAFQLAVDAGATPSQSVSQRTDYLVMGITDLRKVGETGQSTKHRKALALAAEGHSIQIIDEDQFFCLIADTAIRESPAKPTRPAASRDKTQLSRDSSPLVAEATDPASDSARLTATASTSNDKREQLPPQQPPTAAASDSDQPKPRKARWLRTLKRPRR